MPTSTELAQFYKDQVLAAKRECYLQVLNSLQGREAITIDMTAFDDQITRWPRSLDVLISEALRYNNILLDLQIHKWRFTIRVRFPRVIIQGPGKTGVYRWRATQAQALVTDTAQLYDGIVKAAAKYHKALIARGKGKNKIDDNK